MERVPAILTIADFYPTCYNIKEFCRYMRRNPQSAKLCSEYAYQLDVSTQWELIYQVATYAELKTIFASYPQLWLCFCRGVGATDTVISVRLC